MPTSKNNDLHHALTRLRLWAGSVRDSSPADTGLYEMSNTDLVWAEAKLAELKP